MSSLTLTLRPGHQGGLDLSGIVPDRLLPLDLSEIAKLPTTLGGKHRELGELFEVTDGPRDKLILQGDLSRVDFVGGHMRDGMLIVESSVGHGLGNNMQRGHILVRGDAGDYVSSGQRGGYVEVQGNVQDFCAGSRPGQRRGMRGGILRVSGSAGRFLGCRMRRGTVVVGGTIEEGCGSSLIAGTIVCWSTIAGPLGVGMKRGTILCLTTTVPPLHVGFTAPEQIRLSYLHLLLDSLSEQLSNFDITALAQRPMWRSLGDRASTGMGEVLWLVDESGSAD